MSYSWQAAESMRLCGIELKRKESIIPCPFCGGKRFGFNSEKGIGKCFQCNNSADSASYYAAYNKISVAEARKEIESRLGIQSNNNLTERPQKVVSKEDGATFTEREAKRAPDEVLDRTYRSFLEKLPLTEKSKNLLLARGFSSDEIESLGYKTFPTREEINFFDVCKELQKEGCVLEGVPGFFKCKTGNYTFRQFKSGIIMPQKDYFNRITGLQIRKYDDLRVYIPEEERMEGKCSWFSSADRDGGCGAQARVHYACDFRWCQEDQKWRPVHEKGFVLTEGIMKADLTHFLQPNLPVIAVPGVHALNYLGTELKRLKKAGVEVILLCYDMDYQTNPNVQEALENTKKLIEAIGLRCKPFTWETNVTVNGKSENLLKGIDDYLAYVRLGIIPEIK